MCGRPCLWRATLSKCKQKWGTSLTPFGAMCRKLTMLTTAWLIFCMLRPDIPYLSRLYLRMQSGVCG